MSAEPAPQSSQWRDARELNLSLTGDVLDAVRAIAERNGISEGEAVLRAIKVLKFIDEETARGAVFGMQSAGGDPERLKLLYA